MSETCRDVVVVGAGPTGLALAIALRQYGLDVAVLEKEPHTKREVRASIMWQRALEVLRDLGCADKFVGGGLPLRQAEVYVRGHRVGGHEMSVSHTLFPEPLSIEQIATEQLLTERLGELDTTVSWESEAVDVRLYADAAEVDVRGPNGRAETIASRWVVGCEGAHSLVRKALGVPFEGECRTGLQAVQINAEPDWKYAYRPDTSYFFFERRVCLIASPRPGGGYRFFAFVSDPDPALVAPPDAEEMRELIARAAHDAALRLTPTQPLWLNRARFHDRIAASLREGPAMLVGDSAHMWAPIGGRGLNTGLRGAHNLAWKLAAVHHGWARDALLDTYSTEQRAAATEIMRQMRHNVTELPPAPATLAAMRLALPALMAGERFSGRGRILLSDLARHHRKSALSADGAGRAALRAGDRMPDLPVTEGGHRRRLHDLLSYGRWTALLVHGRSTGDGADLEAAAAAVDRALARHALPAEVFHVRPGHRDTGRLPSGTLYLMRPDGHIGLRVPAADSRALQDYLHTWFTLK